MDKRSLSERDICTKCITPALRRAGWDEMLQVREEVSFTKGRIIVRGKLVTRGQAKRADYVLYFKPNIPLALIEAKDNSHSVGDGMQQALDYATTLEIPFVFSSNGDGFVFHDRTGASNPREANLGLDAFPSPADLWARYRGWKGLTDETEQIVLQNYFDDGSGKAPRYYAPGGEGAAPGKYKTISAVMEDLDAAMIDRFEALRAYLLALGDDVQETTLRFYIAFKRIKNFACVEFRPTTGKILVFVKVDPTSVPLEPGFTRDVSKVGHFGTGDLEITLTKPEDLERAMPLIKRSYDDFLIEPMPAFARTIGIDYSGAETPTASLKGLRVYMAEGDAPPVEVPPPPSPRKYWTRKGIAEWVVERLAEDAPTLVGIDHGFSFPLRYFEVHGLEPDWPSFLDDFQRHWPTDDDNTYVDFVRDGSVGNGAARVGNARWRRLTEERAGGAKSVFHFDVQGSVAKSTHTGIPWLRFIRQRLGSRVHFWPFDGWNIPAGHSAIAEVYPALWSRGFARENRTGDQHDAFSIAAWLSRADRDGSLAAFLKPDLSPPERTVAQVEGWILGVPGLIRTGKGRDDSDTIAACDPSVFRLH